ncbi:Lysosomal Cystine Transporter (LCT) Family [Thraustotheca clavata]|uniref:Lysosomal Cystine Transporter (LCT) Family n=1 Tax=Thraustotheca clavata TaxID=74557 RepID=A0A1V9ZAE7_9STRA|nr:Lysosomal Cystine Transporter (LCT) Family [Thraustotheca clavata]
MSLTQTITWIERNGVGVGIALILATGFGLGFSTDATSNIPQPYNRISSIIGWIYFACWSVSFWPQVFLNWRRQSVVGLSLDFLVYNVLGFACYAIFNIAFFWSEQVQEEYKKFHHGLPNAVQVNDVFFALHAVSVSILTFYQTTIYRRAEGQKISPTCYWSVCIGIGASAVFLALTILTDNEYFTVLNFLYLLSYIKLFVSLVKYIPQVYLNYTRKLTIGWTIWNVLLDFSGGWLSMGQIIMTSYVTNDWSAITGDVVKFGLGFTSVFFDIIFIVQHYILYHENNLSSSENESSPLLNKI